MADITYCTKIDCPYKDCLKHLTRLAEVEDIEQVWVSNCSHFCVRNIERELEEKHGNVKLTQENLKEAWKKIKPKLTGSDEK